MANPNQSEKSNALDREENITKGNLSAKRSALYTHETGSDTLQPINADNPLPITGTIEATADPKVDSIVDVQATYIYSGEALPGTLSSVAEWRISRTTIATLETRWADGVASFTKEWDEREGYTY